MCQVSSARQIKAHDPGMRLQQGSVNGKVGRTAGVRLHVDTPFLVVQAKGLQRAGLAEVLDLVDDLVAAVVASSGLALRVLVGQSRAQALHHGPRGEVLRGDQLDAADLPGLLIQDQLVHGRVCLLQAPVAGEGRAASHCASGDALSRDHGLGIGVTRLELRCLLCRDELEFHEGANHDLLKVQSVEVKARGATLKQLLAHSRTFHNAEGLECIVGGVGFLSPLHHAHRHACFAQLGHPDEAADVIQAHNSRHDRHHDAIFAALHDVVQVHRGIQEHLRDDKLRACIDLLLHVDHLLHKLGIGAHCNDLLAVLILDNTATPSL
mmetsp:Transcript_60871/g.98573  ORF Transcript_60871/g.98573 Transcript_60871/m.98573 type:complete len:323 (+) Transcript_60871:181-1149(+)